MQHWRRLDILKKIETPVNTNIANIAAGTRVEISGLVYTARDAIMPRIVSAIENGKVDDLPFSLKGAAIFHTAVSLSGFGPTSSNKEEIENAMAILSKAGVKLHLGKGQIKMQTIQDIAKYGALYIVVPPVSALLQNRLVAQKAIAFKEEGMEALYELKVKAMPGVVAAANGLSIFS